GQAPQDLPADDSIAALGGDLSYPLQYGYAAVGQVAALGCGVDPAWLGRQVFAFQPHQTHFTASPEEVLPLPAGIPAESAVFLPNMETAVNLVMDARPLIGERVAIFGQGIVGLLTCALLARYPLAELLTLDPLANRRAASLQAGATRSLDPSAENNLMQVHGEAGLDLAIELSGAPRALDQAIAVTGFAGRVLIGSWYGSKPVQLDLGAAFHRSRIRLLSSQVSSLEPALSGRWSKARRFELAWKMLRQVQPQRWITHRLPFAQAARGYQLLDQQPDQAIQVIFDYAVNQQE
ncbi:MAG: zinc-binding alcohol dehydrogenase, partial [Anaerolineales bacterium]|nr:zinc-binding alcohol dehydrogenase [Anaerolineales bacterium]